MRPDCDIAVVGGGAAGLMAAIFAAQTGRNVVLLDSRKKIGAKILISGGTRCNVTHKQVFAADYEGGPRHFIKHVLEAYPSDRTIEFFKKIGVELVLEPTGKYFPTTHSGKTVLEALITEAERVGVNLRQGVRIQEILPSDDHFILKGDLTDFNEPYSLRTHKVIMATGGLSLPETGSDGHGLKVAEKLGHTIVTTTPALTPLQTQDAGWVTLSGVTMMVELSFWQAGKKLASAKGSFLFTHFGYSGPVVLDISRHWARRDPSQKPEIRISFVPGRTAEDLLKELIRESKERPLSNVKAYLTNTLALPASFAEMLLTKLKLPKGVVLRVLTKEHRSQLIQGLLNYPLPVTEVVGYRKAEATAGGVDLKEVSVSTMESKQVKGLYFAGEMLDVDGRIGGFNFQWAWSSGAIAGMSAAKSLNKGSR